MRLRLFWLAVVGCAAWPSAAAADPIRLLEDWRAVLATVEVRERSDVIFHQSRSKTAGDFLGVGAKTVDSGQTVTSVGFLSSGPLPEGDGFSGVGTTYMYLSTPGDSIVTKASALSSFDVLFQLGTPRKCRFAEDIAAPFQDGTAVTESAGLAWLYNVSSQQYVFFHQFLFNEVGASTEIFANGVLPPGDYDLLVDQIIEAKAQGSNYFLRGDYSFLFYTFEATPVPEPSSIVLLVSGLLGLVRLRRNAGRRMICRRTA